ncbi:MAG: Methyltransferase/glycosyl transferase fusion protein [candidate division WS6 bacterium 34_10]|uniref:Methyltransferase/glycosyl transferase fusion protein n=1 Tax=candidate division WS6 bacterium 34_10 TaxID=1641389 RepID=A0A101HJ47_9BACT|nr:MAG: Methyltransferase/glycosyl transferase fusion protein [candidate division WS6 bacterium 34_10]
MQPNKYLSEQKEEMSVSNTDIIIPVYNAPEWVKLCVYSIFTNTPKEYIGKVYLINDKSDELTVNCLRNLEKKYSGSIEIVNNGRNLGFINTVNKGLRLSKSPYVLLLNTDCLLSKNTIPKLISHCKKDKSIGLISPISNNAANLSLDMFEGFSYTQMDRLLEKKFKGKNFDACTIVGNCLMLTRECIDEVGVLDESYGKGYGEETDYQFKALSKGFKAKVAIDTYVYHKSEVSFGSSLEKKERVERNRALFFSRWADDFEKEMTKYQRNDPIEYINEHLTQDDKEINLHTAFYLPFIGQNSGGSHVVVDIVNYLVINGFSANILYEFFSDFEEMILFNPIKRYESIDYDIKQIVATLWISVFGARVIADEKKIPLIYLIQGYENYFENGDIYGCVELTHKLVDYEVVISKYLKNKIEKNFNKETTLIQNGINIDLIHNGRSPDKVKNVTVVLRGNPMKGDFLLLEIIKQLDQEFNNLVFRIVYMHKGIDFPIIRNNKVVKILGPVKRTKLIEVLKETDVYVDASLNEGFGLIALEAMAAGAVPIVSNSFGVLEYMKDGENGYIINEVNNSDKYIEKIRKVIYDKGLFSMLRKQGKRDSAEFDFDNTIQEYITYLERERNVINTNLQFDKEELRIIKLRTPEFEKAMITDKGKSVLYKIALKSAKLVPKRIRNLLKKILDFLYGLYDHSE